MKFASPRFLKTTAAALVGVPASVILYDELELDRRSNFCHKYVSPAFHTPIGVLRGARAAKCCAMLYLDIQMHTQAWNRLYEHYKENDDDQNQEYMTVWPEHDWVLWGLRKLLRLTSNNNLEEIDLDFQQWMLPTHERCAIRLYNLFTKNTALYAKFGQALTTIPILPEPYLRHMRKLLDHVPTVEWSQIEQVLLEDLNISDISEVFQEFDKEPISSASLAQVHRATLLDGRKVAVKLQYPQVRAYYASDMKAHTFLFNVIHFVFKQMDSHYAPFFKTDNEGFREVNRNLKKEIDFNIEADNCRGSRDFFQKIKPDQSIYCPEIIDEYVTKRVLAMEFIDNACNSTEKDKIKAMGLNPEESTGLIVEAFAQQLFNFGSLHSDPHSSNVFVRRHPETGICQVVVLDHGLYQHLEEDFRTSFTDYYIAVVNRDEEAQKAYMKKLGLPERVYKLYCQFIFMDNYDRLNFGEGGTNSDDFQRQLQFFKERHKSDGFHKLNPEEKEKRRKKFFKTMGDMRDKFPKEMGLVLRNANILRSINQQLGCPVNRLQINSRIALLSQQERMDREWEEQNGPESMSHHMMSWIRHKMERIMFEYHLMVERIKGGVLAWMLALVEWFGYAEQVQNLVAEGMQQEVMQMNSGGDTESANQKQKRFSSFVLAKKNDVDEL